MKSVLFRSPFSLSLSTFGTKEFLVQWEDSSGIENKLQLTSRKMILTEK